MSRVNFNNRNEGHRVEGPGNRDLEQKLTYQQLLNLNHDLSKENQQLKNIGGRLGQELKNLHNQFDIRPREENAELYNAIGSHPMLHHYELTLIPLLDAYESKIQEFENGFETINEEFIYLEKKYEEAMAENEKLRAQLTDRTAELVEVYKSGGSDKLGVDFGQLILQQTNEKHKFLTEENSRLDREYQRHRSEAEKYRKELEECRRKEQEGRQRVKQLELSESQLEGELKALKDNLFNLQMRNNELDNERGKMEKDVQRAQSQITQLNKDRDGILRNYEQLKYKYETDLSTAHHTYEQNNGWGETKARVTPEETRGVTPADDAHKKLAKLQKEYDAVVRERNKIKEQLDQYRQSVEENTERIGELRRKIDGLEGEKREVEMSEAKHRKLAEKLGESSKAEAERSRRQHEKEVAQLEEEYYGKLEAKQKQINEVEEKMDKLKLEKDTLEQEKILYSTLSKEQGKQSRQKENERAVEKLREKLTINEELFREQLQIVENDNHYLKKEAENSKADSKEKAEELRKLRQDLEKVKRELVEVTQQKSIIIEEIKRVRSEYEGDLRDKERLFDQKIREIKQVVEESDKRRKQERERSGEAARQYKRILEDIKNTYEERIKYLETQTKGKGF